MVNRIYGYGRVSTAEQEAGRQIESLKQFVDERYIFVDEATGKNIDRPNYQLLKKVLRTGDILYIHELDRLGRTKNIIKEEIEFYRKEGIRVKILNIPTTLIDLPEGQEWVVDMVNNILLEVLSSIAEEEMRTRAKRQREGIAYAQSIGKHMGRPPLQIDKKIFTPIYNEWKSGRISAVEAMRLLNLKKTSFYKLVNTYEKHK